MDAAVAVVQTAPKPGEVDANLARARELLAEAADEGATVAVLPELFATGYDLDAAPARAEPPGGRVARFLESAARDLDLVVVAAVAERSAGGAEIVGVVTDPRGETFRRAKRRLWGEERKAFRPGVAPEVAATSSGHVAPIVCYEVEFPEEARAAALAGAELMAVPAAFSTPRIWDLATRSRALENGVFLAAANQGRPFCGSSRIVAPDGQVLAQVDGREGVAVARADDRAYAEWRREHPYLRDL